jgi:hypothetical protein
MGTTTALNITDIPELTCPEVDSEEVPGNEGPDLARQA